MSKTNDIQVRTMLLIGTAALLVVFFLANKFNISFTDYVADRVIQKLEADYYPLGPNVHRGEDINVQSNETTATQSIMSKPPWVNYSD